MSVDPLSDVLRPWVEKTPCAPTLKLIWDQWAVARVSCSHGVFSAPSRGQGDFLKAVRDAWVKYLVAHGAYGAYLADCGIDEDLL